MKKLILIALLSPMVYASDSEQGIGAFAAGEKGVTAEEAPEENGAGFGAIPAGPASFDAETRPVLPLAAGAEEFDNDESGTPEDKNFGIE